MACRRCVITALSSDEAYRRPIDAPDPPEITLELEILSSTRASDVHAYFKQLLKGTDRVARFRTLVVVDSSSTSGTPTALETLRAVSESLSCLTGVKKVIYHGSSVPEPILAMAREDISFSIVLHLRIHVDRNLEADLPSWNGGHALLGLCLDLTYFDPLDCRIVMQDLKSAILSSPNLQVLRLRMARASPDGRTQQYCGLNFAPGDKLPALRELELTGYGFGRVRREGVQGIVLDSIGYDLHEPEVSTWPQLVPWSYLQVLTTDDAAFATAVMPHLTSLEGFEFDAEKGTLTDMAHFFHGVPSSLASIRIPTLGAASLEGICRHGMSLRGLRIHQPDTNEPQWRSHAVRASALTEIRSQCPGIERLSLDLPRAGDWPYDSFDVLASFPNLTSLELWFELGRFDPEHPVTPFLTRNAAEHIFTHLVRDSSQASSTLVTLRLHCGDDPPPGFSNAFLAPEACWEQYNKSSLLCTRGQDEDGRLGGLQSIHNLLTQRSPRITQIPSQRRAEASKGWKRRLFGREITDKHLDDHSRSSGNGGSIFNPESEEVAENGPKRMSQWSAHY